MTYFENPPEHSSCEIKFQENLSRYTYYQIGGQAKVLAVPKSQEDLEWVWKGIRKTGSKYFLLGAGSNILISDRGFDGVVIRLGKLNQELRGEANQVYAGGSVMISTLLRRAAQEGWGGLEFLAGIPGSVGGAVRMNAGTHLGETESRLRSVEALILPLETAWDAAVESRVFQDQELEFQYRKNLFLPAHAVVWATRWEITAESGSDVKKRIEETLSRRKQTQPIDFPSCGSVFKNPKESGLTAWQVLDRLGLRGHQIGNAQISEKHSNFILNLGGAKASDVKSLIDLAKSRASKELGIELREEVIFVGSD
jgi:UDP-N-acetylmuramate dehydrogenase